MRNWIILCEADELQQIINQAHSVGLTFDVAEEGMTIYLVDIRRNSAPKGSGAEAIQALCRYADDHGFDIMLDAENGSPGLIDYYEGFGFELEDNVVADMAEYGEDSYQGPWHMWRIAKP